MKCLSIETSCDETSVAIVENGTKILANVISSQIDIHKIYGGVVPEIASRNHITNISYVVDEALKTANLEFSDIDYIGVTCGPGLVGALLVGVAYAKSLAYALNIPLVPVHHIKGHIAANYITHEDLKPPFMALVVSGGHSHLILVKSYTEYEIVGKTRDDAIGEAFDKVARTVGLPYPGGPQVSNMAMNGSPAYTLPKTKFDNFDFSFSGIKTAVINLVNKEKENINIPNLCASFEENVTDTLVDNTINAMKYYNQDKVVLAGGVAANRVLRKKLELSAKSNGFNAYIPELIYCTDNAAMIACAAHFEYISGKAFDIFDILNLNAYPNLQVTDNIKIDKV